MSFNSIIGRIVAGKQATKTIIKKFPKRHKDDAVDDVIIAITIKFTK